jgi:RsiW-degrading membrane proteinase PrsW (M82 family)
MHYLALFLQSDPDSSTVAHVMLAMMAILPIIFLVVIAIILVPFWFICKKAGYSPWLSMLCLIPSIGMLILLYVLAFGEWKVVPAPQQGWTPQPPYPPPPQPPQSTFPPTA